MSDDFIISIRVDEDAYQKYKKLPQLHKQAIKQVIIKMIQEQSTSIKYDDEEIIKQRKMMYRPAPKCMLCGIAHQCKQCGGEGVEVDSHVRCVRCWNRIRCARKVSAIPYT